MGERSEPETLELVAAYLGVAPAVLACEWGRGVPLGAVAERYGRPVVGLEELVAQTLGPATRRR